VIKLEILLYSHQEHFKAAKDLAFVLPINHPRRLGPGEGDGEMINEIYKLQK
jgi:hypothetical protein